VYRKRPTPVFRSPLITHTHTHTSRGRPYSGDDCATWSLKYITLRLTSHTYLQIRYSYANINIYIYTGSKPYVFFFRQNKKNYIMNTIYTYIYIYTRKNIVYRETRRDTIKTRRITVFERPTVEKQIIEQTVFFFFFEVSFIFTRVYR